MHFEILVEDISGKALLDILIPQFLGPIGNPHTWRLHSYKGVGRLPAGLRPNSDASKRILLDQLPRLLAGFIRNPGIDKIVVVVDSDSRRCDEFLAELKGAADNYGAGAKTMFRLAVEEIEAWYFGDQQAIRHAYPRAKGAALNRYVQDSVCGTWEILADALYPGGSQALKRGGWRTAGQVKHEWATTIGPRMVPDQNISPSFRKLRDGILRLANEDGIRDAY
jgi:hypothetical protein